MNQVIEVHSAESRAVDLVASAPFFVRGKLVEGTAVRHKSRDLGVDFVTPALDLDALIAPRTEPGPLFDVKLSEILDFLAETGERMRRDENGYFEACVDRISVDERPAADCDRAERSHGC